jgi:hypothetical protein
VAARSARPFRPPSPIALQDDVEPSDKIAADVLDGTASVQRRASICWLAKAKPDSRTSRRAARNFSGDMSVCSVYGWNRVRARYAVELVAGRCASITWPIDVQYAGRRRPTLSAGDMMREDAERAMYTISSPSSIASEQASCSFSPNRSRIGCASTASGDVDRYAWLNDSTRGRR